MKRKLICAVFALVLVFAFAANAFAATLNTSYSGYCYRAFTPSGYLQRSSSDAQWSYLKVNCTECWYDGLSWNDHLLKIYNSTGERPPQTRIFTLAATIPSIFIATKSERRKSPLRSITATIMKMAR